MLLKMLAQKGKSFTNEKHSDVSTERHKAERSSFSATNFSVSAHSVELNFLIEFLIEASSS